MDSLLAILVCGALQISQHKLRQSVDCAVSALLGHLLIREPCAATITTSGDYVFGYDDGAKGYMVYCRGYETNDDISVQVTVSGRRA